MAYDSTRLVHSETALFGETPQQSGVATADQFRRSDRLVVVFGAGALGVLAGVALAFSVGRVGWWPVAFAAPAYAFTLYLAMANFRDAADRRAFGCAALAGLLGATIVAWPVSALFVPLYSAPFWLAPAAIVGGLLLSASCWSGANVALGRFCMQAALIMAGVGYVGVEAIMN
ncbi:MAG: hypothetical protein R3C16_12630 [Hyphomonadaceae bacterium]